MKLAAVASWVLLVATATAADAPRLNFPEAKIRSLPRSLLEAARQEQQPTPFLGGPEAWFRSKTPSMLLALAEPSAPKQISRMPVLVPKPSENEKAMVKVPDASIAYKLLVKVPDVEVVNEVKAP